MKDPLERTKVVVRRLPPAISQFALMEQIDGKFAGRYKWFCFRPGKNSQKSQRFSRAYIDFIKPEDVVEFAEFFNGHMFVNEKGTQYKAAVEYAPSQLFPKPSKKDGREGTIFKDPEYMAFVEQISKPAENLPSAEIQLERKEAEKAGAPKEMLIVTPLMEFVRQKRASKNTSQKSSANGKASRRSGGASSASSLTSKRSSEKKKQSAPVYVLRDSARDRKDKPKTILVVRRDEAARRDPLNDEIAGTSVTVESGKKKLILLKGKERDTSNATPGGQQQQAVISPSRQSQRHGGSGKIIKSILSKEAKLAKSPPAVNNSDQGPSQPLNLDRDKRPPRHPNARVIPSREHAASNQGSPQSNAHDMSSGLTDAKSGEGRGAGSGRGRHHVAENSSHKHAGRRGQSHGSRENDNSELKAASKRGPVGYSSNEKQIWVQKS